ncbi:MAG: hypothetical protein JWL90_2838, partial [Chthoniobacteraceae bacterium]|nr:hypothetical protein [Chthoniobacteraceae bacterium]
LVKPVGDKAGMVRIQLPARIDPRAGSSIMLLYETPKPAWHSRGGYDVAAPRLSKSIPILKSNWQVYLPDGFQYTGFKSNLRPPVPSPEPLLVRGIFEVISSPWEFLRARRRVQSTRILSDLRMVDESVNVNTAEPSAAPQAPGTSLAETAPEMQLSDAAPENPLLQHSAKRDSAKPLLNEALQRMPSPIPLATHEANLTPAGVAGLLPIKMELARAGQSVTFDGLYDAQSVAFHYEDSWARARRLWFWLIGGALLFLGIGGWRHPWWRSIWTMLILSFIPLCISETATPVCNALLCGWLAALLLHRIAVRFIFTSAKKEVAA